MITKKPLNCFLEILKNRFSGETGNACSLHYDLATGCLAEVKTEVLDDF